MLARDGEGPYKNGVGGASCTIVSAPGVAHEGWLYLYFPSPRKSTREIRYLGQGLDADGRPGYSGFDSRGSFEVKGLTKIGYNGDSTYYDIAPFRANVEIGQFNGDSNATGEPYGNVSSSVFVRPLSDGCTWEFWSDPAAPRFTSPTGRGEYSALTRYDPRVIELRKMRGTEWITQGVYAMPFGATVKITGVKAGCGQ